MDIEKWVDKPVRPLVTLGFAAALIYGFAVGMVSPDAFLGVAGTALGFWFQARTDRAAGHGGATPGGEAKPPTREGRNA